MEMRGSGKKFVFRLLDKDDIRKELVGRHVYTLWPDNGIWYKGKVKKCNPAEMTALLFYQGTDEKEEADLEELIGEKQIAFSEERAGDYVCGPNEIEQKPEHFAEGEDGEVDDGAILRDSDSEYNSERDDVPSSSDDEDDEVVGRSKRKRKPKVMEDFLDDDALGDELPLAMRKAAGETRKKTRAVEEDAEEDFADRLIQSATMNVRRSVKKNNTNDPEVREKVKAALQQGLDMAYGELGGSEEGLQVPADVASIVEEALFGAYGGTTKDYKTKMRSLQFNLKDPNNKELRAHVLRGDITPDTFVRMTANELASKELAEYRKKKEEEALKMSVLDAEAAAKFSTAAALETKEDKEKRLQREMLIREKEDSRKKDVVEDGDKNSDEAVAEEHHDGEGGDGKEDMQRELPAGAPEAGKGREDDGDLFGYDKDAAEPDTAKAAKSLDWASIKSASMEASKLQANYVSDLGGMEAAPDDHDAAPPVGPTVDENLEKLFLPCPEPLTLGPHVWEGLVSVPGVGNSTMSASALQGSGDLQYLLGKGLTARGRLSLQKLDSFLSELHLSKHRTASVGVLQSAKGKPKSTDVVDSHVLASHYRQKDRAGVAQSSSGVEVYLIPSGPLSEKILVAVHSLDPENIETCMAVGEQGPVMDNGMLLAVVVHKKEMAAKKREATKSAPEVALPEGLDFNAISALAAAIGVGSTEAPPPPPAPPAPPMPMQSAVQTDQQQDGGVNAPIFDPSALSALSQALGIPEQAAPMAPAPHAGSNQKTRPMQHLKDPRRQ
ncbi:PHD finger protein 3 [Picochlorum sp. SENEW3]|nr:PHD finger protein 3 [Picochlorum sp. SENEW3]WPT17037.1 PHD finger protein 3 [Picochlorum sp. SENEW3]